MTLLTLNSNRVSRFPTKFNPHQNNHIEIQKVQLPPPTLNLNKTDEEDHEISTETPEAEDKQYTVTYPPKYTTLKPQYKPHAKPQYKPLYKPQYKPQYKPKYIPQPQYKPPVPHYSPPTYKEPQVVTLQLDTGPFMPTVFG